jgi:hypothetical protein
MYQRRPKKHPKIIKFVRYYVMRVHFRKAPDRPSHNKAKEIIDNLHNLHPTPPAFPAQHTPRSPTPTSQKKTPSAYLLLVWINGMRGTPNFSNGFY